MRCNMKCTLAILSVAGLVAAAEPVSAKGNGNGSFQSSSSGALRISGSPQSSKMQSFAGSIKGKTGSVNTLSNPPTKIRNAHQFSEASKLQGNAGNSLSTMKLDSNAGKTLGKRKKPDTNVGNTLGSSKVDPNAGKTLGKRKKPDTNTSLALGKKKTDPNAGSMLGNVKVDPNAGKTLGKRKKKDPSNVGTSLGGAGGTSTSLEKLGQSGKIDIKDQGNAGGQTPGTGSNTPPAGPGQGNGKADPGKMGKKGDKFKNKCFDKFCWPLPNFGCAPCYDPCLPCYDPCYIAPCYGGGVIVVEQPVVVQQPVVVEQPVVVQQPVVEEQSVVEAAEPEAAMIAAPAAEQLPKVPVGATITLRGEAFGDEAGKVAMQVGELVLPATVTKWEAKAVTITLPQVGLAAAAKGKFLILKADGTLANKIAFELVAPQAPAVTQQ